MFFCHYNDKNLFLFLIILIHSFGSSPSLVISLVCPLVKAANEKGRGTYPMERQEAERVTGPNVALKLGFVRITC